MERRIVPYASGLAVTETKRSSALLETRLAPRDRSAGPRFLRARRLERRAGAPPRPQRPHRAPQLLQSEKCRASSSTPTSSAVRHPVTRIDAAQLLDSSPRPVAAGRGAAGGARGAAVDRRPDAARYAVARREEGGAAARPPRRDCDARGRRAARARRRSARSCSRRSARRRRRCTRGGGAARRGCGASRSRRARRRSGSSRRRRRTSRRCSRRRPRAAAEAAAALVDDETAVAALLPCRRALARGARRLVCDLPPAPRAFAISPPSSPPPSAAASRSARAWRRRCGAA